MRKLLTLLLFIPLMGLAQERDTLAKNPDSLDISSDKLYDVGLSHNNVPGYENAKLNLGTYFTLLGDDLKQQLTFPFHASPRDWLKIGKLALLTGAVALINKPVNQFALKLHDDNKAIAGISRYVTNFGGSYEVYAIAGFYAYGLISKSEKQKTTTALATQAYIAASVISTIGKYVAGEQRPYFTDPNRNKNGPIFHGPFYAFQKGADLYNYSSFPSGHTTAAFAAATVYAMEYRDKPIIPIISYSAATLIGLSRLTENKHWATDVLVGAILGYFSGKQVVNNYHRYSASKRGKGTPQPVSLHFQYNNKQFGTGLVYKF
jgi:membrane-associated phospholipid phosphatase